MELQNIVVDFVAKEEIAHYDPTLHSSKLVYVTLGKPRKKLFKGKRVIESITAIFKV